MVSPDIAPCSTPCLRVSVVSAVLVAAAIIAPSMSSRADDWKPADGPLMTRWAGKVDPENVLPEYPRPQMVRKQWLNLNGLWDYAVRPKDAPRPDKWDGKILVPFPVESALSGVKKPVGPDQRLWYRRTFHRPDEWKQPRTLLHFGAVDWHTTVWIDGVKVGEHKGGYDPFTFDITDALCRPSVSLARKKKDQSDKNDRRSRHEIIISVWDPTDAGPQPRGKQVHKPRGIWYTAVTGIWQTVWLEPVPQPYLRALTITPDLDASTITIIAESASETHHVSAFAYAGEEKLAWARGRPGEPIVLKLDDPRTWSPDDPFLYRLHVSLDEGIKRDKPDGRVEVELFPVDKVESYFGMRKIEVKNGKSGVPRLVLNNKPLFQYGPLDQGWWPDGLYTAPTDAALKYDLEVTKKLGFNMVRKHVKVEPARWYYWCDKLGLLVWQDMPSAFAGPQQRIKRGEKRDAAFSHAAKQQFEIELQAMIDSLRNHPSIVMWVPFNEGWGQYDTRRITNLVKQWDPTRLVDNPSGWTDRGVGDVHDIHAYPGPAMPAVEKNRAAVLGEFGGLGLPLKGHTWQDEKNWGYRSFKTKQDLTDAYVKLLSGLRPLIGKGLAAAVYTQTTDVEIEVNGLMTYDRAVIKMDEKQITAAAKKLYQPPPEIVTLVPASQEKAQSWRYTTEQPAGEWMKPGYDDSSWKEGRGGFGEPSTPGSVVRTRWKTNDIWLHRTFELDRVPDDVQLLIHHDETASVYLNGVPAAVLEGYTTSYVLRPIAERARKALRPGRNTIAIHCRQTAGGQYIDAGLVEIREQCVSAPP